MPPVDKHITCCFTRTATLVSDLAAFMAAGGATIPMIKRTTELAAKIFPILIWKMDMEELESSAQSAALHSSLTRNGISTSALTGVDIPSPIRQSILPVLRLDTYKQVALWWEEIALPNWIAPFFLSLDADNAFEMRVRLPVIQEKHED